MTTTTGDGGAGTGTGSGGAGTGPVRLVRNVSAVVAYGVAVALIELARRWPRSTR